MPRPSTKVQLLAESQKEYQALERFLSSLAPEQMCQPGILGDWSAKDVLMHLYEWGQMLLRWLAANQRGETPHIPAEGYKWSQLPALNERIRQKHQSCSVDEALILLRESHQQITDTIQGLDEEDIFTPGLCAWMNQNTLAAYFTSVTSSHYRWARTEMSKSFRKTSGKK